MRVLFVVQRYGAEVAGGAERACREYAEHLAAMGVDVEVVTSCARSYVDWANVYEPGETEIGGVRVHRLPVGRARADRTFGPLNGRVMGNHWPTALTLQHTWARVQGPVLPDLEGWLDEHHTRFDVVSCFTYLYWPTHMALRHLAGRVPTVLHPLAHDEPALEMRQFDLMVRWADGLSFLTPEERSLVERRFGVHRPSLVAGIGVDPGLTGDGERFRARFGLGGDPYLLYLGRIDPSKGAKELLGYVRAFRSRHDRPLRLVAVGEQVTDLVDDGVVCTGFVDEQTKLDAIAGCLALAQPSYYESFSIVLVEAWSLGRPAIVQGHCAVLDGQARRSGGAIPYDGYEEWEAAVELLLDDPALGASLGAAGARYVEANYRWSDIAERYRAFLAEVVSRTERSAASYSSTTAVTP
jgi:glycosyltransferase involved in cell wall biosynthesis